MAFIEENENGLVYMRSTLIGARHAFSIERATVRCAHSLA